MKKKQKISINIWVYPIIIVISLFLMLIYFLLTKSPSGDIYDSNIGEPQTYQGFLNTIHPINTDIVKASGKFDFKNTTNIFKTFFKNTPTQSDSIVFKKGRSEISFYTPTSQSFGTLLPTETLVDKNTITYKGIYPAVDLKYSISSTRLLEEFIINDKSTAKNLTTIDQQVSLKRIDKYQIESGEIAFYNKDILLYKTPKPVMYELNNSENSSYGIEYKVNEQKRNQLTVTKNITPEGLTWLSDPDRQYPIVIDLVIDNADTSSSWVSSDTTNTVVTQETTIKQEGTGSVKVASTGEGVTPVMLDVAEYASDSAARNTYNTNGSGGNIIVATGGTIATSSGYTTHTYTSSGAFNPGNTGDVEILIVAGGGGGGSGYGNIGGGGGGAGGLQYDDSYLVIEDTPITVTIGAGGAGSSDTTMGANGSNSIFGTLTSIGGGGGASYTGVDASKDGASGGSGGGATWKGTSGGSGTQSPGYGNDGALGSYTATRYGGGGGGGAGAAGTAGSGTTGGAGGAGKDYSSEFGTGVGDSGWFAGGGGGGAQITPAGAGGQGGGGGGSYGGSLATSGTTNTGGGGGGGGATGGTGGGGSSGIVIVRYLTPELQTFTESTIKTQGLKSLKGYAKVTTSLNKTLTRTVSPTLDLSDHSAINFDIRSTRTGSNIKIGIHDSGGTTTEVTPNITSANTFQEVDWDISAVSNANKDAIDQIIITLVNADSDNIFYIDDMVSGNAVDFMDYAPFSAVGGTITTSGEYTIHTFTNSGTFISNGTAEIEALVVGGGGGGGETIGGGGGGGGVVHSPTRVTATSYSVTIGAGGAGGLGTGYPAGEKGEDSSFAGLVGIGGGAGGGYNLATTDTGGSAGGNGAGGGARADYTAGQGYDGGDGDGTDAGGGGGGAGETGTSGVNNVGGAGGDGIQDSISGSAVYYGGGGGGGARNSAGGPPGSGGTGGGGDGGQSTVGDNGTTNTGGGGGGSGYIAELAGGSGGSGIVIIRYLTTETLASDVYVSESTSNTVTATGGTITDVGGFRIHTFTSSGTFTPNGSMNVETLVVGGGGAGGNTIGGGGGGGGLIYDSSFAVTATGYSITIGSGGSPGSSGGYSAGIKGDDSTFSTMTAIGGGGGAGYNLNATGTGGSAGGDGANTGVNAGYTVGQGYDGGTGGTNNAGGGGGGTGEAGTNASAGIGGGGGDGLAFMISGQKQYYAGGGGGGSRTSYGPPGSGGQGGGGDGGITTVGEDGTANTGGGGGAGGHVGAILVGGSGGSGVVIIRYPLENEMPIGGIVTDVGDYRLHTFKSDATDVFVPAFAMNAEVLVVGGGGGGGTTIAGGGGGGGVVHNTSFALTTQTHYIVTVGTGGNGVPSTSGYPAGIKGDDSIFSTITAVGGGGGAGYNVNATGTGGSAGGDGGSTGVNAGYTVGQGYDGGTGGTTDAGGGGGGASEIGSNASLVVGGAGGDGYQDSISGSSVYYAGGGGGGARNTAGGPAGSGGLGGGGAGGLSTVGTNGTANTGGGGGGGGHVAILEGGNGGTGIVIIKYLRPLKAYIEPTITTQGLYSLKGIATTEDLNRTLSSTVSATLDLTDHSAINFDIRSTRTGSNIKIGIHDSGGTTTEVTPNITSANTFQEVDWDISAVSNANKDAIDQIIITLVNADSDNTFYIDNMTSETNSTDDTITLTKSSTDLSSYQNITYWVRSDTTGSFARFEFGESASSEQTNAFTINSADTWEQKTWDISSISSADRDAVTKLAFKFTSNTSDAILYFDDVHARSTSSTPTLDLPIDTATNHSVLPSLKTTATDPESDYLRYKIELCENVGMSTNCQTLDQTVSQTGWSGQDAETSTAYASSTQATYTIQSGSILDPDTTYYWRSYAKDPGDTDTWSGTQGTPYSFTTSVIPSAPTTPHTEGAINPTEILDTTPEFSAIHNDPDADSADYYQIEVDTQVGFDGAQMWDSAKQSMTTTADTVRSPDLSYAGTSLSYGTTYYWRIKFWDVNSAEGTWSATQNFTMNYSPSIPSLDLPTDTDTDQSLLPSLKTTTTDPESDYLHYKIELCENVGMSTNCQTLDQTVSQTGWSGQDAETSTAYASSTQATYTIQSGSILDPDTTYYWRSYAKDPGGTDTWSSTQATPYSFTTIPPPNPPSNCKVVETSINLLTVSWTDNSSNEDYFDVEKSTNGGAYGTLDGALAPNSTSIEDSSFAAGNYYRYRIASYFTEGPTYSSWCYTNTLGIDSSSYGGINLQGVTIK